MPPKQYTSIPTFLADLDPALAPVLQRAREVILGAHPEVQEGIKWNCLSFFVTDYFGTLNVRPHRGQPGVLLVLHTGAKVKAQPGGRGSVEDPSGLLEWLAPDRAVVRFSDAAELAARQDALAAVVRSWIGQL